MDDEANGADGIAWRGAVRGEQLLEQMVSRVAAEPHLPQHASKQVDQQRVVGMSGALRSDGERDSKLEFWRGHEGRFYSERRSNSTRARAQSTPI